MLLFVESNVKVVCAVGKWGPLPGYLEGGRPQI